MVGVSHCPKFTFDVFYQAKPAPAEQNSGSIGVSAKKNVEFKAGAGVFLGDGKN